MKKEELLHLHMLLYQVKKVFERNNSRDFSKYNLLNITPFQIHRSREEHVQAILVLAQELASMAMEERSKENGCHY